MANESSPIVELAWIRQFFFADPDGPGVVIRDAEGSEIREWMARVDELLTTRAARPTVILSDSAPEQQGGGNTDGVSAQARAVNDPPEVIAAEFDRMVERGTRIAGVQSGSRAAQEGGNNDA